VADAERADLGDGPLAEILDTLRTAYPDHTIDGSQEVQPPPYAKVLRLWGVTQAEADTALEGYTPSLADEALAWRPIVKPINEARNNTAVLADDTDLKLLTRPSVTYIFRSLIFFDTNTTANFLYRWNHTGINGGIRRLPFRAAGGTAPAYATVGNTFGAGEPLPGSGSWGVIGDQMILITGVTGGLFSFQWAQNTADPGNTTIIRGSYFEYLLVG
jgi:hypothetical protein